MITSELANQLGWKALFTCVLKRLHLVASIFIGIRSMSGYYKHLVDELSFIHIQQAIAE